MHLLLSEMHHSSAGVVSELAKTVPRPREWPCSGAYSRWPGDLPFACPLPGSGDARLQENALAKTQQSEAETPLIFIVDFFNQQIQ